MKRSKSQLECRQCKQRASVPDVVPYFVRQQFVWLHPTCAEAWHQKYRNWLAELRRAAA
ncbi:MAG TPA: hypothetical protein VFP95_07200 [Gammaproteobacteria bacterium]|nr:hypothetical protein [Gammaproteobacteria bacterium]